MTDDVAAWVRAAAQRELPALLDEALADARAEVRARLRDQLVDAMLHEVAAPAAAPVPAPAPPSLPSGRRGLYVYGVTAAPAPDLAVGDGVAGAPVDAVSDGPLAAVVGEIPLDGAAWTSLNGGQPDLAVLEEEARRHERVLEALVDRGAVVPFRFGTVVRSRDDVVALLRDGRDDLVADLTRLAGRREWGVSVTWDGARARAGIGPSSTTQPPASGAAYLEQRRREVEAREDVEGLRAQVAGALHDRITTVAVDAVVLERNAGGGRGRRGPEPVLRAAYLVPDDREAELQRLLEAELAKGDALGLAGELTGPWPPYHFVRARTAGAGR